MLDDHSDDPTQRWIDHIFARQVLEKISSVLSERELYVVTSYICEGRTLDEISKVLGVSRERVRQLKTIALRKIMIWYRKHHGVFRYRSTHTT